MCIWSLISWNLSLTNWSWSCGIMISHRHKIDETVSWPCLMNDYWWCLNLKQIHDIELRIGEYKVSHNWRFWACVNDPFCWVQGSLYMFLLQWFCLSDVMMPISLIFLWRLKVLIIITIMYEYFSLNALAWISWKSVATCLISLFSLSFRLPFSQHVL